MFTGIVQETGTVAAVRRWSNLHTLLIRAGKVLKGLKAGESVAVDGVCLTVTEVKGRTASFDIMKETLRSTTLGTLKTGERVNLEGALKWGDRLGGHFVTGHVDAVGVLEKITKGKKYVEFRITVPFRLRRYLVPKGSVCVSGISLTVGKVTKYGFSVHLIPYTIKVTNFSDLKEGCHLNIETDILAKYILKNK